MSDLNPNDNLPGAIDDLNAIGLIHPDLVAAVTAEVARQIQAAEEAYPQPKMGAVKKQLVENTAAGVFEKIADALVDAAALIPGFPIPLVGILKDVVIPALPGLIDQLVHHFNATGLFKK